MNNEILEELIAIRNQRIVCFTEKVRIDQDNKDDNNFKIILVDEEGINKTCNFTIYYNELEIKNIDSISVIDRKMLIYYNIDSSSIDCITIDLYDGYIEIYNHMDDTSIRFDYVEFKLDQKCDIEDIEFDKYPLISSSITNSEKIKGYYEICLTIRMSPIDSTDYNIRLFSSINDDYEKCLSLISEYRNKIISGEFANFFNYKLIKFNDEYNGLIKKDYTYEILDYHYNEDVFVVMDFEEGQLINIPFIATLGAISNAEEDSPLISE